MLGLLKRFTNTGSELFFVTVGVLKKKNPALRATFPPRRQARKADILILLRGLAVFPSVLGTWTKYL